MSRLVKSIVATVAIVGSGYVMMIATSPSKEKMLKMLPKEDVSPEKLSALEKQNAELFRVMADNAKLDKPIWQIKARPELDKELKHKETEQKVKSESVWN